MENRIVVEDILQHEIFSWTPEFTYFKILWKIPNFLNVINGVGYPKYIGSSKSLPIIANQFSADLRFYPTYTGDAEDRSPRFDLHNDIQNKNIWNSFRLTVLDKNGSEIVDKCSGIIGNIIGSSGWGYPQVFSSITEMILQVPASLNILIHGFIWENEPKVKNIQLDLLKKKIASAPSLLGIQDISDIILSVGEEQFHCHKHILSAASSNFRKLFKTLPGSMIIVCNVSSAVFREIIHFIYEGTFDVKSNDFLLDLFKASHNYKLALLKYICERKIMKRITVCNAVMLFKISDELGAAELEDCVTDFIIKNRKQVLQEKSWKDFSSEPSQLNLKLCLKFMESK